MSTIDVRKAEQDPMDVITFAAIVAQVAEENNMNLIDLRISEVEAGDILGIPELQEGE